MWEAIGSTDYNGYYCVEVVNPIDDRHYFVDVDVLDDNDVVADWNQYIFYMHNVEDVIRKYTQEDNDNFVDATGSAICYLEATGYIEQDDRGRWKRVNATTNN